MPKDHFWTDVQLMEVGRRYGSNEVALEGSETGARWKRDLIVLALYGHGQAGFDAFQADLAAHAKLRAARPEVVAEKKMSVAARDEQFAQGWGWVRRVNSMLGVLARTDQPLATALNTAIPADDVGLEAGIRALAAILTEYQGQIPPDAHADKCLFSVDPLCTGLQTSPGAVHTAKGQAVADTAQIDLYDGKLYLCMRDLNEAGNTGSGSVNQNFVLGSGAGSPISSWQTTSSSNMVAGQTYQISGGAFAAALPGQSITTFVGTLSGFATSDGGASNGDVGGVAGSGGAIASGGQPGSGGGNGSGGISGSGGANVTETGGSSSSGGRAGVGGAAGANAGGSAAGGSGAGGAAGGSSGAATAGSASSGCSCALAGSGAGADGHRVGGGIGALLLLFGLALARRRASAR